MFDFTDRPEVKEALDALEVVYKSLDKQHREECKAEYEKIKDLLTALHRNAPASLKE